MSEANSLNASFPGEVHLKIENNWLIQYQNNDNAVCDTRDLDSTAEGRRMRPRGILIGINGSDTTATSATVKGVLWGENKNQADVYSLAVGVVHPIAFRFIYANGTTGRNIKIFG